MLSAHDLTLSFSNRTILDRVSITLLPNERIALVGQNGAGKSSLLRLLFGEPADGGWIEKKKQIEVGLLKQIPDLDHEASVVDIVRTGLAQHLEEISEHQRLCTEITHAKDPREREKLSKKIDSLALRIEQKGGFDVDYFVERVLSRLGIKAREQKIGTLSGGEMRRVDLARILLSAPDVYLLDEPTNHLDLDAIRFLTETLTKSSSAVLFVSHDTAFIDELATRIAELDNGKLYSHEGPFANYLENKLVRELIDAKTLHRRERLVVGELAWLRAGTPARTTKQNARIDRAYALIDQVAKDTEAQRLKRLDIETAKTKRLGGVILELERIEASFGSRILFKDFDLKVVSGQRYGILGQNGAGKTTLLSILANRLPPTSGRVILGKNTEILVFDQHRKQLDPDATLKETLANHGEYVRVNERNIHIASYLEKYLFSGNDAGRKVKTLSGGEQNRLVLAKLLRQNANCLLLDEPTNDLDVTSLAVLEEVLLEYDGVAFIVSHDRRFLDRVCNAMIVFEQGKGGEDGESKIEVISGNYSDYLRQKAQAEKQLGALQKLRPEKPLLEKEKKSKPKQRRSFKEEREFQEIEGVIEGLESERSSLHAELSDSELFRKPETVQIKLDRLKALDEEIEKLYARWQELSDMGG